jgi:hypothetical protein
MASMARMQRRTLWNLSVRTRPRAAQRRVARLLWTILISWPAPATPVITPPSACLLDLMGLTTHESRRSHVSLSWAGRRNGARLAKMALRRRLDADRPSERKTMVIQRFDSERSVWSTQKWRCRAFEKAPVCARFRLVLDDFPGFFAELGHQGAKGARIWRCRAVR